MYTRKENPYRSSRNIRQSEVNRNVHPNHNPSNPNRVNQNLQSTPKPSRNTHRRNPLYRYGVATNCPVCQSINHWAQNVLDRSTHENNTYILNEVVLHQTDNDNPQESPMSETWSAALLDCGARTTVCGKEWFKKYVNNLCEED